MTKKNKAIKMNDTILLLQHGFVSVSEGYARAADTRVATIVANMAYYGFAPSKAVVDALSRLIDIHLEDFWACFEKALKYVKAADRKMGKFVVYKNFPSEVLSMSEAEYWMKQLLMYWGLPNELVTEEEKARPSVYEKIAPTIVDLADDETPLKIYDKLIKQSSDWTEIQSEQAGYLMQLYVGAVIDLDAFSQKTNGVKLIAKAWPQIVDGERSVKISTATDVMRLAAALSEIDVSLRVVGKFRKFSRPERRVLVSMLNGAAHLEGDLALRKEQWKRLLSFLRPGDFKFENVSAAYDRLYKGELRSFASAIEAGFINKDAAVLKALQSRPGEFLRRLHKAYAVFGREALELFVCVFDSLTVSQLVKLDGYLSTANSRKTYVVTPAGSWAKAQIIDKPKANLVVEDLKFIRDAISTEIGRRLKNLHPEGFAVAAETLNVKLQSNGQELASYGRGTVFDIPENVTFLRTASYWRTDTKHGHVWFDNGFNFFGYDWEPKGSICWNSTDPHGSAGHWASAKAGEDTTCLFSGDPTNAKELKGRACQMIDLYPQNLVAKGVRYAVWNILAYSRLQFSDAKDLVASLQWGENAETGKLYEPSRAQMVFPITGNGLTKFIAYIDLVERKLVYLDVGISGATHSATNNETRLSKLMPSLVEHLASLPSIADLFGHAQDDKGIPVVENDEGVEINGSAYVFKRLNSENDINQMDVEEILKEKPSKAA